MTRDLLAELQASIDRHREQFRAAAGAAEEAGRRIAKRWTNRKCPECGLYGWEKP